jgi:peptidoglycan-associated lipoprotein
VIEGNTDLRGSREYNIALGQRRANAVKSILRMQGVPNKQIRTVSYGAEKPIAFGHTEAAYRLNRRDDLRYEN